MSLEQLLARARQVEVRPGAAETCVADVLRAARLAQKPARPWWGIALGAATAAAVALVLVLAVWPKPRATEPVRVGDRVAIVAAPGTQYRVVAADADHTEIEVERGAVTARLWHGARGHHLVLRGAGVEAIATGTVYTLGVDDGGAWVQVAEGTVVVQGGDGEERVAAGTSWRTTRSRRASDAAATQLLAMSEPPPPAPDAIDAGVPVDAAPMVAQAQDAGAAPPMEAQGRYPRAARQDAGVRAQTPEPLPISLVDRWRRARLLRAQGEPQRALDECLAIADADDATWSPIALVEAVRIALDALAAPERAVEIADRVIARWPQHGLIGEVKTLRCRALRQLGRDADCDALQPE